LVVDEWSNKTPMTYTPTQTMTAGLDDVQVEHFEGDRDRRG
jgi:hypothetical protein